VTEPPARETRPVARHASALRAGSLGTLFLLIAQYGLGVGVNLFVHVPDADQNAGVGGAFGKAMSNGPAALAAHAGIGVLLVLAAIAVLVRALLIRRPALAACSIVGLLCIVGAAVSGAAFVSNGQNSASMAMAVLTGVAVLSYVLNLFLLPAAASRD
jgi:hypothetical protein